MHCLRDASALRSFLANASSPELIGLIEARIEELSEFDDIPLSELINIHILDDLSLAEELENSLHCYLAEITIEVCLHHKGWTEIVVNVSDDGFGHVIFIPSTIKDSKLRALCSTDVQQHHQSFDL